MTGGYEPATGPDFLDFRPLNEPVDPTWRWWNAATIADPQRQPKVPTLIAAGHFQPQAFADLAGLADRLAQLLAGRPACVIRSVASLEGFDTFPAFSVSARGPIGETGGPPALAYLATVAVQTTTQAELEAAIAEAVGRAQGQGRAA